MINLNKIGLKPVLNDIERDGCSFRSLNPRAYDAARAIPACLDKPSETAGVNEYTIYRDPSLLAYKAGAPYGSRPCAYTAPYATKAAFPTPCPSLNYNINAGEIGYYVDKSIQGAFYKPVFDMPAKSAYINYTDPMDSWKPSYIRRPITPEQYSCLTSISDSSFFREDIMSIQVNKWNRSRSTPFL